MKLTEQQKEFIKDNYSDKVEEVIHEKIDNDLIYYDDIQEKVNQFSNITECLRGEYTMDNLYDDMYNDYYNDNFDDIATEVYDDLDEEQQKEVDDVE